MRDRESSSHNTADLDDLNLFSAEGVLVLLVGALIETAKLI